MKVHRFWLGGVLPLLALCSCSASSSIPLSSDEYVKDLNFSSDVFNILQLTDIHYSFATNLDSANAYLTAVKDQAEKEAKKYNANSKIDLIMVTGDTLLEADKAIANSVYDLIDSWKIPYDFTYGNHDRQGNWSPDWMKNRLEKGDYSLYDEVDDDIWGHSNYVLDIKTNGTLAWQIYSLDSNSYLPGAIVHSYDYIHDDQVQWYEAQADVAKTGENYVPSLAYFHIPLRQWVTAYENKDEDTILGEAHESFCPSKHDSSFFDAAKSRNMKGMFCGHDHSNDWTCQYEGVVLGYGVKANRELYYHKSDAGYDITGGSIVTLHKEGTFDLTHFYVNTDDTSDVHEARAVGL